MGTLEIVSACFSILAATLSIYSTLKSRKNEARIKKIQQEMKNNQIENSIVNQSIGDITIEK